MKTQLETALKSLNIEFKSGTNYIQISCPFAKKAHKSGKDSHPSFCFYPKYDFVKCFSCGYKSNTEEFFSAYGKYIKRPLDFDFLEFCIPEDPEPEEFNLVLNECVLDGFNKNNKIRTYLKSRKVNTEFLGDLDLLYDSRSNNLVLPVRDETGQLFGATGRNINRTAHYHYFGMLTSKCLAGFEKQDASKIIIVEGLTDLINGQTKINELELDYNIYATLTCRLSDYQANLLIDTEKPIYFSWDQDEAGINNRKEALTKLSECIFLTNCLWDNHRIDVGNMNIDQFKSVFD